MPVYPVKTIIIDDEPIICNTLHTMLEKYPDYRIIATGSSVEQALALIPNLQPQLLLLDISLPDGNAFDILQQLQPLSFKVIFITAFEKYAVKAIKYGALDYILKPIDETELATALLKNHSTTTVHNDQLSLAQSEFMRSATGRIALRDGPFLHIADIADILYLQSAAGITNFFLADGRTLTAHKTIKEFEDILPTDLFFRAHQSYLVNISYIESYHRDGTLHLRNNIQLPVSHRRRELILEYLSKRI